MRKIKKCLLSIFFILIIIISFNPKVYADLSDLNDTSRYPATMQLPNKNEITNSGSGTDNDSYVDCDDLVERGRSFVLYRIGKSNESIRLWKWF